MEWEGENVLKDFGLEGEAVEGIEIGGALDRLAELMLQTIREAELGMIAQLARLPKDDERVVKVADLTAKGIELYGNMRAGVNEAKLRLIHDLVSKPTSEASPVEVAMAYERIRRVVAYLGDPQEGS